MIHIREAVEADNDALVDLQSRCPQGTTFVASIVNTPDFFTRARMHEDYRVYVACDDNRVVGSIACTVREGYVNGGFEKVGRVFQLFVDPACRGKRIAGQLLQSCEEYLNSFNAVLSYGYIVEGNVPSVRNILRQGYVHHRAMTMPGIPVFREMRIPSEAVIRPVASGDLAALAALINKTWEGHTLFEHVTTAKLERLLTATPGFSYQSTFVLEEDGQLCCCMGYWDLSRIMRMTVKALSLEMRLAGLLLGIGGILLPLPRPPGPGEVLRQAVLEPIAFAHPKYVTTLLKHVNNVVRRNNSRQIFFGCEKGGLLFRSLGGFTHIDVTMHLYVKYLRNEVRLGDGPVYMTGLDL